MGGSEKSAHKQKENRHTFLTTPGANTFHEAVPDCFIVLIRLKVSLLPKDLILRRSRACPRKSIYSAKIS